MLSSWFVSLAASLLILIPSVDILFWAVVVLLSCLVLCLASAVSNVIYGSYMLFHEKLISGEESLIKLDANDTCLFHFLIYVAHSGVYIYIAYIVRFAHIWVSAAAILI